MASQKLPEIDVLRIISILIVVLLIHIPQSYAYNFYLDFDQFEVFLVNNVGIYIAMGSFVFVSGFGLSLNPNNRNLTKAKNLLAFIKKRFLRIFPLYWIAIVLFLFFVGYLDIDPLYLMYHFFGLQIILAPYFGPPMLTLWFIGIIVIYYLIYIVLNLLKSPLWIILMAIAILFFFVFLNGAFGLVEIRFFRYYNIFILGIITAHIYTSPLYIRFKERLREKSRVIILLISLGFAILGFISFQFLTQYFYSTLISEYGTWSLYEILLTNPDFYQMAAIIFITNLTIIAFLTFIISTFSFIFHTLRLIFSKRKVESVVSVISYSTYGVYLFHRVFLAIFIFILTTSFNLDMREENNYFLVLIFVPFIFLFSYLIQKAYDWVWKRVFKRSVLELNLNK